jgi:endogenous inhibitor of DNA gyrase (YacG/DUF329 family)
MTEDELVFVLEFKKRRATIPCPDCGRMKTFHKDGSSNGRQRFRCSNCSRSMNIRDLIRWIDGSTQSRAPTSDSTAETDGRSGDTSTDDIHHQVSGIQRSMATLEDRIPIMIAAALATHLETGPRSGGKRLRQRSPSPVVIEQSPPPSSIETPSTPELPPTPVTMTPATVLAPQDTPETPDTASSSPAATRPRYKAIDEGDRYPFDMAGRPLELKHAFESVMRGDYCGPKSNSTTSTDQDGSESGSDSGSDSSGELKGRSEIRPDKASMLPHTWELVFFTNVKWAKIRKIYRGLFCGGLETDKLIRMRWHRKCILEIIIERDVKDEFTHLVITELGWKACRAPFAPGGRHQGSRRTPGFPSIHRQPTTPEPLTMIKWFFDALVPRRSDKNPGIEVLLNKYAFSQVRVVFPAVSEETLSEMWVDSIARYLL